MSWRAVFFLLLSLLIRLPANAHLAQEGNISIYAGPLLSRTQFNTTASGQGPENKTGLGLIVLGDINSRSSLEIGLFYFNKLYLIEKENQLLAEQTDMIHITMGYRRWLSESFALSAAFASGYSVGDVTVVQNTVIDGSLINTSARDVTEYGLDLSALFYVQLQKSWSLVFDTRYSYSLTAKKNEKANHMMILLGLQHPIR